MAYSSKNPKVNTQVFTDQGTTAIDTPASGSHALVDRNGTLYIKNSSGVETAVGGQSSGEKNYVTNPSANSAITGWVASGSGITIARDTTGAELPRENTTGTGFKITNVSGTDYVRYRFSIDDVDKSVKLKIQFALKPVSGYVDGDMKVEMYTNSASNYGGSYTAIPLSTDVSGVSGIPNAELTYVTTFDSSTADYYELRITRVANTSAVVISDVIVGPGILVQGAVVDQWLSYTPTIANFTGTVSGKYRRVGDTMDVLINGASTSSVSSTLSLTIPSGLTIDTSKILRSNGGQVLGTAVAIHGALTYAGSVAYNSTTSVIIYSGTGTSSFWDATNPFTWANADSINIRFTVPIAEWSGSGTVNLGQNDVEYASVETSFTDTSSTATVYGQAGTPFSSTALTATRTKTITWQTPIQPSDLVVVEFKTASGQWVPFPARAPYSRQSTTEYGVSWESTSSTQTVVTFGQYITGTGATYASAGSAWSNFTSTSAWRARKVAGGLAVGFGLATTQSAGLVGISTQTFAGNKTFNGNVLVNAGLSFPATQFASSDPNTLDDYEEGTWSPTVSIGGTQCTTLLNDGKYTKIGRVVFLVANINMSAISGSGSVTVEALPFAGLSSGRVNGMGATQLGSASSLTGTICSRCPQNTAIADILMSTGTGSTAVLGTNMTSSTTFNFTLTYIVS